jgi:hypothetical protein
MEAVQRVYKEAFDRGNRECYSSVGKFFPELANSASPLAHHTASGGTEHYGSAARLPRTLDKVYGHHLH